MTKDELLLMLWGVDDDVLLMSRKNCHAMHVSSVVLSRQAGQLTRVFLAWPGHQLHKNAWPQQDLTVGIHNHRYNLTLEPVAGFVLNEIYRFGGDIATWWDEYSFSSGVTNGKPEAYYRNTVDLSRDLTAGGLLTESQKMSWYTPHTVAVFGPAAWLVREGEPAVTSAWLFVKAGNEVQLDPQLYQPFDSADEVRAHVRQFFDQHDLHLWDTE